MAREAPIPLEVNLLNQAIDRFKENTPEGYEDLGKQVEQLQADVQGKTGHRTDSPGRREALRAAGLLNKGTKGVGDKAEEAHGPDKPAAGQKELPVKNKGTEGTGEHFREPRGPDQPSPGQKEAEPGNKLLQAFAAAMKDGGTS